MLLDSIEEAEASVDGEESDLSGFVGCELPIKPKVSELVVVKEFTGPNAPAVLSNEIVNSQNEYLH